MYFAVKITPAGIISVIPAIRPCKSVQGVEDQLREVLPRGKDGTRIAIAQIVEEVELTVGLKVTQLSDDTKRKLGVLGSEKV